MRRKPIFETVMQQFSGSVSTLVVIAIGAATLYFLYRKGRGGGSRPAPPRWPRTDDRGDARAVTTQRSRPSVDDTGVAAMVRDNKFIGAKICVAWEVFFADGDWKEHGLAKKVLQWYAFSCDLYVMCRITDPSEKEAILSVLRGVDGLQRHKILFCTTQKGYEAFTRQVSPTLLVTNDQAQASFLSGVLPYIALIGHTGVLKANVLCSTSVQALCCPAMETQ